MGTILMSRRLVRSSLRNLLRSTLGGGLMEFNILSIVSPVLAGGSFILKRAKLRLIEDAFSYKQRDCLHAEFLPHTFGDSPVEVQYRISPIQNGCVECLDCRKRFPGLRAGRLQARRRVEADAEKNGDDDKIVFRS